MTRRRVSGSCGMGTGFGERCAQWTCGKGAPGSLLVPACLCVKRGPQNSPALCTSAPTNPVCIVCCREAEDQETWELAPAGSAEAGPDGAAAPQQPVRARGPRGDENQPRKDPRDRHALHPQHPHHGPGCRRGSLTAAERPAGAQIMQLWPRCVSPHTSAVRKPQLLAVGTAVLALGITVTRLRQPWGFHSSRDWCHLCASLLVWLQGPK